MFSNLRMRVEYQRERIFIYNMPMQHIHFIVHHRIDSFENQFGRQKVSGGVDHQSSVRESRLIFDANGQIFNTALLAPMARTSDRLHEGLKSSNKTDKSNRLDARTAFCYF